MTKNSFVAEVKGEKGPITPSRHAPLSRHHANYDAVSRITP